MIAWRRSCIVALCWYLPLVLAQDGHHGHHASHGGHEEDHHHHDHGKRGGQGHTDHGHDDHEDHGGHGTTDVAMKGWQLQWWIPAYASALVMSILSFAGAMLVIPLRIERVALMVEYSSLTFAATVLVADALVHLLPHALEGADHETMTKIGIAATFGCLAVLTIPGIVEWSHRGHVHEKEVHAYGWANLVTEMMHNFVDGISLGIAWRTGTSSGLSTALAVAVHELPQEIGDFMVLRSAGFPVTKLLCWNFLASLTCLGGVALVHVVGQTELATSVQRYATAGTAGSFLALSLNMIFPQVSESISKNHSEAAKLRAKTLCVLVAMVAIYALVAIGELEVSHEHGSHGHGHHGHGEL